MTMSAAWPPRDAILRGTVIRTLLSWSSGKDSAWALQVLRQSRDVEVVGLLTTFNARFDSVAMHGVRRELAEAQAVATGLPLWSVPLPWPCTNLDYESAMDTVFERALREGIEAIAFGDLFLSEIRDYREIQLKKCGLNALFPLWQFPTAALAEQMIRAGLRARLTCIDPKVLDRNFAGREFDLSLLADFSPAIDPCGENGEFHTFVFAGPMFRNSIPVSVAETCERDGFIFSDLLLQLPSPAPQ